MHRGVVQPHVIVIPCILWRVGHLENLGIGDVALHTAIAHGQRIVPRLQSTTPKLLGRDVVIVSEDFFRLCQRTIRGRLEEHAIVAGSFFNVQTYTTVGASRSRGQQVVGAHRGIEPIAIGGGERHRPFEILYHGLVVFVMEHGGAASDFVRPGFQPDEGLRHGGRCRFGHIGVRGTRGLGERIVDLIHVVEGLRHNHLDFTVVLTLHLIGLRIEIESLSYIRCDSSLHRLTGVATVDLRHLHCEGGVGFL